MDHEDMFEEFQKFGMKAGFLGKKVSKVIQPTEEEVMEWIQLKAFYEAAKRARGVYDSKAKLFWSKVELRTGEVNSMLEYDEEKSEIRVLKPSKEKIQDSEWES